jgi:hypothetical protein
LCCPFSCVFSGWLSKWHAPKDSGYLTLTLAVTVWVSKSVFSLHFTSSIDLYDSSHVTASSMTPLEFAIEATGDVELVGESLKYSQRLSIVNASDQPLLHSDKGARGATCDAHQ